MTMQKRPLAVVFIICGALALATHWGGRVQAQAPGQAVDESGAPVFKVDPFWPKPLPNRWSMQQVTGHPCRSHGPHLVPQPQPGGRR